MTYPGMWFMGGKYFSLWPYNVDYWETLLGNWYETNTNYFGLF